MFHNDVANLLLLVVQSWQVIVITIALVLYIALVNYVARTYHQPRFVSGSKPRKKKAKPKAPGPEMAEDANPNAALGLEEA